MTLVRRLAVIGDVHAEDERLDLALRTAAGLGVDLITCTGDVVDGRGSAARCCALLRQHSVACVRGNHDRWLFSAMLRDVPGATQLNELRPEDRQFVQNLPATRDLQFPNGSMLLCHGIGDFDLAKITQFDSDYSLRTNRHLRELIDSGKYRVLVNGHSHERLVRRFEGLIIINAGALCHDDDPGFLLLDFSKGLLQWHSIRHSPAMMAEETAIF